MKLFSCHGCDQIVFFESVRCTRCGHDLVYLADRRLVSAVAHESHDPGLLRPLAPGAQGSRYRLCRNGRDHGVCNWTVSEGEGRDYCRACALNQVIPNLGDARARGAWHRLEIAKRRLIYTLEDLKLPIESKADAPLRGLAFSFLADEPGKGQPRVYTGHADGVVTINIAEADDPSREKARVQMGEAYRTLLGHFRHEVGHYYWDRLIANSAFLGRFRDLFGDEQAADYPEAQKRHYSAGPPADWPGSFVSAYASMHPWEDWAETWAHYLHMVDTLETARAHGMALKLEPAVPGPMGRSPTLSLKKIDPHAFDQLLASWLPVTLALNNLNRSMGHSDWYPFVLPPPAVEKLRFVHEVIENSGAITAGGA